MSDTHIEENLLEQYAMDALPEQQRTGVDEHLLECMDCQARLIQVDAFLHAFRPAVVEMRQQPTVKWRMRFFPRLVWLAPAAATAMLVFLVFRPGIQSVAPAIIQMRALRGIESVARLTAGQPAVLVFDVAGRDRAAKYEVEVVSPLGKAVFAAAAETKEGKLSVPLRNLEPGSYWVRVYRSQPEKSLLEEYALKVAPTSKNN